MGRRGRAFRVALLLTSLAFVVPTPQRSIPVHLASGVGEPARRAPTELRIEGSRIWLHDATGGPRLLIEVEPGLEAYAEVLVGRWTRPKKRVALWIDADTPWRVARVALRAARADVVVDGPGLGADPVVLPMTFVGSDGMWPDTEEAAALRVTPTGVARDRGERRRGCDRTWGPPGARVERLALFAAEATPWGTVAGALAASVAPGGRVQVGPTVEEQDRRCAPKSDHEARAVVAAILEAEGCDPADIDALLGSSRGVSPERAIAALTHRWTDPITIIEAEAPAPDRWGIPWEVTVRVASTRPPYPTCVVPVSWDGQRRGRRLPPAAAAELALDHAVDAALLEAAWRAR